MRVVGVILGTCVLAAGAVAQPDASGIEFVTIGAPGNAAWQGDGTGGDRAIGRGGVDYEYRIGKYEVTTSPWVEFFNAAYDRPQADWLPHLTPPTVWGASATNPNTPGGRRWSVFPGNEMRFVGNISWRMAAMYCNWLHNGRSTDRSSFLSGAYDVSTFGYNGNVFTDQLTRSPGALYWIPSWDEWLKAGHFDPHRFGPGQAGWWTYSNGTNTPLIAGPPGVGQANYGFSNGLEATIPLGAYAQTMSPWGLFDMAGATMEWTEGTLVGATGIQWRQLEGSMWGSAPGYGIADSIYTEVAGEFPSLNFSDMGFRVASAVPSAGTLSITAVGLAVASRRRRTERHGPR